MSNITENASTNAKLMSLLADNGTSFRPGQKIIFNLDPSIAYMKPEESYLVFDLLNNSSSNLRLCLGEAGISGLIQRVDIYSKESGTLLETLQDYNKWTATQIQYTQDDKTNAINLEGVCAPSNQSKSANVAAAKDYRQNTRILASEPSNFRVSPCVVNGAIVTPAYTSARFTTPLRCGIFREWDDEKLVPLLLLGGLRIELTLAPGRQLWTIPNMEVTTVATNTYTTTGSGQNINSGRTDQDVVLSSVNAAGTANVEGAALVGALIFFINTPMTAEQCPYMVGNLVTIRGTTGAGAYAGTDTHITQIREGQGANNDQIEITVNDAVAAAAITQFLRIPIQTPGDADLDYRVTNVEMRVMREDPPSAPMKNTEYIFTTYDMFRDTIPQNQSNFTSDITSTSSQALSIFTMYENPLEVGNQDLGCSNYYSGLSAGEDGFDLNSVVYFINNKLYPLRAYNPQCVGDKVITQNELVKAFGTINRVPKCLGSAHGCDLNIYCNRFLHARELARGMAVFNLQNAEPQIRLGFNGNRSANMYGRPITSTNMYSFVFSKRTLQIDGDTGLTLIQ
tara:strand:- start:319 stop:2019 length:1701 start_codon:yes stop_codon:yes gene_type:complete